MLNIAVLILAAGRSSRMKEVKQLIKINNKTLLNITIEKARTLKNSSIFCVLGANASQIKKEIHAENFTIIYNNLFNEGLSSSIVTGIQYFKQNKFNFKGVLILLADQPAIESSYLKQMLELFENESGKIIASQYDKTFGVPALIPSRFFEDLQKIKGDKGAKAFLNEHKNNIITPKTTTNLVDLDTKEDVHAYQKQIK